MKTRILKITGISVAVLACFVLTAPYIFKGKITSLVRASFSKELQANVNFSDVDISLFRNFPKISIGLNDLTISCVGEFQDDTLLRAKKVDMACNIKSLIAGHGIHVNAIIINEPKWHATVHANGHANWNIFRITKDEPGDSIERSVNLDLQRYNIHAGAIDYWNEGKKLHIVAENLEQEGAGNFDAEQFDLKTRTTADVLNLQSAGSMPYALSAKTNINVTIHVDTKTHSYAFNTDQIVLNDLKLHAEGFFQWINDSSYNMNIRYKVPSTDFKNLLSMLPSVYQKNYAGIEVHGNANFNGYIKGKYDGTHAPAHHTNLYVMNGYIKYPDLPLAVEHIRLGIQIYNPDGLADHLAIDIADAHAEVSKDTVDMHLLVKTQKARPYIDLFFRGKMDLANVTRCLKLDSAMQMAGSFNAGFYAKGIIPGKEKQKKEKFQSGGDLELKSFSALGLHAHIISIDRLLMSFNPDLVRVNEMTGMYGTTPVSITGTLNNLYDFAFKNKALNANLDLKAGEINLRDIMQSVPANINFAVNAEAEKLHFDNLDLQNVVCQMQISEQAVNLLYVKANGLDGDIMLNGSYSTLENKEHPEIALTYDVKGVDIQKTFLAFNSIRRIMPVAKYMTGNVDAHMTMNGKMNPDMTTDLASLEGQGSLLLLNGTIRDFGPMDKLARSLDVAVLKNMPMTNVKAEFVYKNGSVTVSPFALQTKEVEFDIEGIHGFDQSLDYDVSMKLPKTDLGKKGSRFVKNVVKQAADKGIPVKLRDAVRMDVKMTGTINSPDVKTDMNAVVSKAETDLKKQVDEFVNAKLDSAKQDLHAKPEKKPLFVQTSYKSKNSVKARKTVHSTHKKAIHSKTAKKKKKPVRNYTTTSKKSRSI